MKATFVPVIPEGFERDDSDNHITCLILDEEAMLEIYMWSDGTVVPNPLSNDNEDYVRTVERLRSSPLWEEL